MGYHQPRKYILVSLARPAVVLLNGWGKISDKFSSSLTSSASLTTFSEVGAMSSAAYTNQVRMECKINVDPKIVFAG